MAYGVAPPAYRLPPTTRPGVASLLVSDLNRSLDYYEQILGLRVLDRGAGWADLGDEATAERLVSLRGGAAPPSARRGARLGLYHFALLLPGRSSLGRFLLHLETLRAPVASADHAVSEALYLWDPDGLGIEVYADRPRESWRTVGDELFMTSEALDTSALIAAADGIEWSSVPAGTRMGHFHLHVGDLDRAEAFYSGGLGLDKIVWSYPGALFLSAGGYHHHLALNTWARNAPSRGAEEPGLLDWELRLPSADDVEAAGESLAKAGAKVARDGAERVVPDDWGTKLRLTAGR